MAAYALIAEFDRQLTEVYRKSVEQQGIEAVIVRDGDAATRVLQARGAPLLLICDLSLPQADGFSVIAELRRTWPPERTAILVFSAHAALRAAAWNLWNTLGIAGVADKNQLPGTSSSCLPLPLPPRCSPQQSACHFLTGVSAG